MGTLSVCLANVSLGTLLGYPTKALTQLKNETNIELQMDENLGSWFAASFWIAGIFLCPLGGWLGNNLIHYTDMGTLIRIGQPMSVVQFT